VTLAFAAAGAGVSAEAPTCVRRVILIERQRDQSGSEAVSSVRARYGPDITCSSMPLLTGRPPTAQATRRPLVRFGSRAEGHWRPRT
jgi:hypothetical protein